MTHVPVSTAADADQASPSPVTPALSLDGVTKRFGAIAAVEGLTFDVRRGEMFGLIGPDGAGKTTTLRLACGLVRPDAGSIRLHGIDPFRDHRAAADAIGYVSQRFSLYGDLSIDENIAFFATIHGVRDYRARRDRLLDLTGLTPFRARLADRLSGGMKQKLALACTLVHEPPLLVLDEPTTGVDPVSRREFWKLLAEFVSHGLTIVMATPYLDEAERCTRVALLSDGSLIALDEPAALQRSLGGATYEVVAPAPRAARDALRAVFGREAVQLFGDRLHVRDPNGSDPARVQAAMAASGAQVEAVRAIVPTLEDVFIERLARQRATAVEKKETV
jgi:ABC-2 type transport system ATP-binding protein